MFVSTYAPKMPKIMAAHAKVVGRVHACAFRSGIAATTRGTVPANVTHAFRRRGEYFCVRGVASTEYIAHVAGVSSPRTTAFPLGTAIPAAPRPTSVTPTAEHPAPIQ